MKKETTGELNLMYVNKFKSLKENENNNINGGAVISPDKELFFYLYGATTLR